MTNLTPKKIVAELNRYIVGQDKAKKAVAIALRNRWRRRKVTGPIKDEILPKNILMIGPTGVGKTEIARRIAKLSSSPFIKVEATKFTEVGYVGRDVESIIRDLLDISINIIKEKMRLEVKKKAKAATDDKLVEALVGENASEETKEKFRKKLEKGEVDDKEVEIELQDNTNPMSSFDIPGAPGAHMGVLNISDLISKAMGGKTKTKKLLVKDARKILMTEESDKLIDEEKIIRLAIDSVENEGIVFLDEIDKITTRNTKGGEVSREGVQRDLLPLIEGTVVSTKYGSIKTDHILFIASGAFHMAKPSDLLPELQGRLPIRVELNPLTEEDMIRILTEPESSLLKQYTALMQVEKVKLEFAASGIKEIAKIATEVNKQVENIGARRLHTILEKILEDISFNASDDTSTNYKIDAKYVKAHLDESISKTDLAKFIL